MAVPRRPTPGPTPTGQVRGATSTQYSTPRSQDGYNYGYSGSISQPFIGPPAPRPVPTPQQQQQQGQPQQQQQQQQQGNDGGGFNMDDQRNKENEAAQKRLQSSLGVYDQRSANLQGQIPDIQRMGDLRQTGLDTGLQQFIDTSGREEGKRVAEIGEARTQIGEQFVGAERSTRASAKSIGANLRRMFGGAGVLDSTAYKDANIESSRGLLQQIGDLSRDKAGRIATTVREEQDIKNFYAEQISQSRQNIVLEKNKAKAETDSAIKGIMGDISLNDRQKVEMVDTANERLEQRMTALASSEATIKESQRQFDKEFSLKEQALKQKGTSSGFKAAADTQKATNTAQNAVAAAEKRWFDQNDTAMPASEKAKIFTQYGGSPDKAKEFYMTGTREDKIRPANPVLDNPFFQ